ncbi:butyrophilin subfamily 2 member A2 isoform X1 [Oreochromis niloticus]|uniref:Butyrophilin subfamily 2 member A2 n=2 Tax=Oreochromis niloticus TaxID=8128 RepID=A0A669DWU7_ORENI|nr:butyrophilin subfamily 2 member A2 isoform X1 [Oreochromis niloticus]
MMMYHRLFVIAGLLSAYIGGSSAQDQPVQVLAFAGGDVILPCSFNISDKEDFPTVEWSKEGLKPDVVFLYRDGCEAYEMKNPAFEYRTSLIMKELKDGNISLRISNVQVSDTGKYKCLIFQKNAIRKVTKVELVVVAVSEPKLSVISVEGGDIALHCEANCWLPEPQITFLDDKGKKISEENPKREQDACGCFTVTRRATLQRATSSVTCRVHQPEFNQTRETTILIPACCMKSDLQIVAITIGGTAGFLLAAAGLIALLFKPCGKFAIVKQPVTRKSWDRSITCESDFLLTTDNLVNCHTGQMSEFLMDDETIKIQNNKVTHYDRTTIVRRHSTTTGDGDVPKPSQLFLNHSPDINNVTSVYNPNPSSASTSINITKSGNLPKSRGSKIVIKRQDSFPGPGHISQRNHRMYSSPNILQLHSPTSNPSSALSSHQMINSSVSPHRNTRLPQRRHSSVLPHLAEFNKHHNLLRNLPEGDEQKSLLRYENKRKRKLY